MWLEFLERKAYWYASLDNRNFTTHPPPHPPALFNLPIYYRRQDPDAQSYPTVHIRKPLDGSIRLKGGEYGQVADGYMGLSMR